MAVRRSVRDYIYPLKQKLVRNHAWKIFSTLKIGPEKRTCPSISKWVMKNVFWLAFYILGSYLTISECLSLVQNYNANPISTAITASMGNSIPMPNITICLPINTTRWFPLNTFINSSTPYSNAIGEFFEENVNANGKYQLQQFKVSNEALVVLQKYLAILYKAERLQKSDENPFINSRKQTGDEYTALLDILVPKIEELNITIDQIKDIFANYFFNCQSHYSDILVIIMINAKNNNFYHKTLSYWDEHTICFSTFAYAESSGKYETSVVEFVINVEIAKTKLDDHITIDYEGAGTPPDSKDLTAKNLLFAFEYDQITYQSLVFQASSNLSCTHLFNLPYFQNTVFIFT
jgi:hypothetical protein